VVGKKKKKKKPRVNQEEELSWVEWETRRHVIIKHMFSPEEAYVRRTPPPPLGTITCSLAYPFWLGAGGRGVLR
jgi:hypothetical protein